MIYGIKELNMGTIESEWCSENRDDVVRVMKMIRDVAMEQGYTIINPSSKDGDILYDSMLVIEPTKTEVVDSEKNARQIHGRIIGDYTIVEIDPTFYSERLAD